MPATPRPAWKTALVWVERLVTTGLLIFVAIRLGPQVGALVGVARDQGRAPAYALVTMNGDTVRSADLAGKVVVVNFWATWCIPCRLEMPSLQALHERHVGDDVVVLGFATDVGGEQTVRDFLADRGITYPVGRASQVHRQAFGGIPGIPTTFLVDRQGNVRHKVVGYFAPPALNAAVNRLLAEVSPRPQKESTGRRPRRRKGVRRRASPGADIAAAQSAPGDARLRTQPLSAGRGDAR